MYYIGRALCRTYLKLFGGFKSHHADNIPKTGPVLLAPNHISFLDPPIVGSGVSRMVHFMAKEPLFKIPILGFLIHKVGAFPVKRGTADRAALKRALELLSEGKIVCIFPEGTRSHDLNLLPPELGFAMIALKSHAPVVPVAVIGAEKSLSPKHPLPCPTKTKVVYGKPMTFDDLYDQSGREALEEVGRRVMEAIAELRNS